MPRNILALSVVDKIIGGAPYMVQGGFADCIWYAKALGYDGIELNISDPDRLDLPAIRQALAETGVKITAFGTGRVYVNEHISLTDKDEAVRAQAFSRLVTFSRIAAEFDAKVIIGCIRGNIAAPEDTQRVLDTLAQSLTELEKTVPGDGSCFVMEPINRYENNFLCNVADTARFLHDAGLKRTKLLMDTFHMNIEDGDLVETIRAYGKDTAYVHIADSNRKYPGLGHTDFPALLDAFREIGYDGPYCAECHANGDMDEGCTAWLAAMKRMLAE